MLTLTFLLAVLTPQDEFKAFDQWDAACQETAKIRGPEVIRVTTAKDWEKLWRRSTGKEKAVPPRVDFKKHMVVVALFSKCPGSPHYSGISLDSAKVGEKEIKIGLKVDEGWEEYACNSDPVAWFGVFPKKALPIRVVYRGKGKKERELGRAK